MISNIHKALYENISLTKLFSDHKILAEVSNKFKELAEYHQANGDNIRYYKYKEASFYLDKHQYNNLGNGMIDKIREYKQTHRIEKLDEFKKNNKLTIIKHLLSIYGIGYKKALELYNHKYYSVQQLQNLLQLHNINQNSNQSYKIQNIKFTKQQFIGILYYDHLHKNISHKNFLQFIDHFKKIITKFNKINNLKLQVLLAGSYIHQQIKSYHDILSVISEYIESSTIKHPTTHTFGDIDLIVYNTQPNKRTYNISNFIELLVENKIIKHILQLSQKNIQHISFLSNEYIKIDIHFVNQADLFYHLLYFGIGEIWARQLRKNVKKHGYTLNQYGLYKNNKKIKLSHHALQSILYT